MKFPTDEEECFRVDLVDQVLNDEVESLVDYEPLRSILAGNSEFEDEEFEELVQFLDTTPQFRKFKTPVEPLKKAREISVKLKPSIETPPDLELKPLPNHLRKMRGTTIGSILHAFVITSLCAQQGVQWDDEQMQLPSQDITHVTITKFKDWAGGEPHPRGKGFIIQPASSVPPPQPTQETEAGTSTQAIAATGDRHL